MANTIVNAIPYTIQGDGVSTTVSIQLGYAPTTAVFVNAFNANTGASVTSNVASISLSASILTINFNAGFSYLATVFVNVLPALPVLTTGTNSNVDGIKFTYRVATGTIAANVVTPDITPFVGQIFQIQGSATKTIRIINFEISGRATTAGGLDFSVARRSTAASGGTPVTPTISIVDPVDPAATAVATYYTAAPTVGTIVGGPFQDNTIFLCDGKTAVPPYLLDFGDEPGAKAFVLRGTSDFFTVSISAIIAVGAPLINFWCEWTEE
jgi:hypothetical protein